MRTPRIEIETFDFIDQVNGTLKASEVYPLLAKEISKFGFTNFLITEMPPPNSGLENFMILNGWSQVWFDRYVEQGFYRHDPMARHTRETTRPFFWSEVTTTKFTAHAKQVMNEASECGLNKGFSIPLIGSAGEQSCVTMGGRQLDIPSRGREALHLMSIYAHDLARCHRARLRSRVAEDDADRLTPREREVLKWVSRGKTDWEIGEILKISAATSTAHMQNICRKLRAVTRAQAVASGIRRREILL